MNGVEGPEVVVVALGGDDGDGSEYGSEPTSKGIGPTDVTGEDRNGVPTHGVDADDGGVRVLGLRARGDGPDTDAESADKDETFVAGKVGGDEGRDGVDGGTGICLSFACVE